MVYRHMKRKVSATTRLLHDLFTQYQNTFLAFCELINNSIQAKAKSITITIDYSVLLNTCFASAALFKNVGSLA